MNEEDLIDRIKKLGFEESRLLFLNREDSSSAKHNLRLWGIPRENYKLDNSPFYQKSENVFAHFTSLESLYSILGSKEIRMYNLVNMDDKMELEYARKELDFPHLIENIKEDLYCLSLCSAKDIDNDQTKEHLLWKLHGKEGYGVMLKLSFKNHLSYWLNYNLTKVIYNLDIAQPIKHLHALTNREAMDPRICSFFKMGIYEFENETRLIFDNSVDNRITKMVNEELVYPVTYQDKLLKGDNIKYVKLPLYNFNKENENTVYRAPNFDDKIFLIPAINIDEIILGYRYQDVDLENLKTRVKLIDPEIRVNFSNLKKYY